jgi:hypothetical protein
MEGFPNYVLTVVFFGTLFSSVLCVFYLFEKTLRSSAGFFFTRQVGIECPGFVTCTTTLLS